MFDWVLSIPRVLNMLRLEYARAANMLRLHRLLCKLYFKNSRYLNVLNSEYAKVLNASRVSIYYNLRRVLNKMFHRIYLSGF